MLNPLHEEIGQYLVEEFINKVMGGKKSLADTMKLAGFVIHNMIRDADEDRRSNEHQLSLPTDIYGMGSTIKTACENWAEQHEDRGPIEYLEEDVSNNFEWSARITSNGDGVIVAGVIVNDIYVITWWK